MHTFFHGLRRKAGGVTLVMACALAGMWMRSRVTFDRVLLQGYTSVHVFRSEHGQFCWSQNKYGEAISNQLIRWESEDASKEWMSSWRSQEFHPNTKLPEVWINYGGFTIAFDYPYSSLQDETGTRTIRCDFWAAPYGLSVLLLTLLSAYLILWKPRKRASPN